MQTKKYRLLGRDITSSPWREIDRPEIKGKTFTYQKAKEMKQKLESNFYGKVKIVKA